MSEPSTPQFEHSALEGDIKRLTAEVAGHRERPEFQGASSHEILKESLRTYTGKAPSLLPPPLPPQPHDDASPLPAYTQDASPEVRLKIEELVDKAFHEGILNADKEAQKEGPFVLDAFHDTLTGKLYPELKRRGILE